MSWIDRLKPAAYNSPSGARLPFLYEDVSKFTEKRTAAFEFPDAVGTFIQDNGRSGRRVPLRCVFSGTDYDLEAKTFEAALLESGAGRLEHPAYGPIDVVPFGTIKQRDDLKTAANQAIIEVVFWETIGVIYPASQGDPASAVLDAVDNYNDSAAEVFEDVTELEKAADRASLKNKFLSLLSATKNRLDDATSAVGGVQKQFDTIFKSINGGIDVLVGQPTTLAFQTALMIQSPARSLTAIQDRLTAYGDLITSIVTSGSAAGNNEFRTADLYASTYVTGSTLAAVNNQFETRSEALGAAEIILAQFDAVVAWRDGEFQNLNEVDTGDSYQKLQEAVAIVAGFLVEISFSLKQERTLVLTKARSLIDLVAELYGEVDEQLDFFINTNDLTGSEIIELPAGKEVVYYV